MTERSDSDSRHGEFFSFCFVLNNRMIYIFLFVNSAALAHLSNRQYLTSLLILIVLKILLLIIIIVIELILKLIIMVIIKHTKN